MLIKSVTIFGVFTVERVLIIENVNNEDVRKECIELLQDIDDDSQKLGLTVGLSIGALWSLYEYIDNNSRSNEKVSRRVLIKPYYGIEREVK